jgi:DNA-binding NarL/FixJ family response regulator
VVEGRCEGHSRRRCGRRLIAETTTVPARVLLADDTADIRALLRIVLSRYGDEFEVVAEAADGSEAIAMTRAHDPDLVVLDLAMPVMDGLAALPAIRAASPDTRVVILSGYPQAQMGPAALEGGAVGYLQKGLSVTRLADELLALGGALDAVSAALDKMSADLSASPATPATARRLVAQAASEWDCAGLLDTVTLLTSEVVTNAVEHAGTDLRIDVELLPEMLRISVSDSNPAVPEVRNAADHETSGRGMAMVDALSQRWGVDRRSTGKTVWFELARPDRQPA